jgi:hypothetical protein
VDDPQLHLSKALPAVRDLKDRERAAFMADARRLRQLRHTETEAVAVLELIASPPGIPELLARQHVVRIITPRYLLRSSSVHQDGGVLTGRSWA